MKRADFKALSAEQQAAAIAAHDYSKQTLQIVSVNRESRQVFFRTSSEDAFCHDTLFAYDHDSKTITFYDPHAAFPTELDPDDDAGMFFCVCSNDHLASCIAASIYRAYSHIDKSQSYDEIVALENMSELIVDV